MTKRYPRTTRSGQRRIILVTRYPRRTIRAALHEAVAMWAVLAWDSAQRKTVDLIDRQNPWRQQQSRPLFGPEAVANAWVRKTDPYYDDEEDAA